jgi:tetratricopeptide (TPR) repeat protein
VKYLTTLRDALRGCDEADTPGRAALLATLASVYRGLDHHRRGIECLLELTRLPDRSGAFAGWGYCQLAEAYLELSELDLAAEALDSAEHRAPRRSVGADPRIAALRARVHAAAGRLDDAILHGRMALESIEEHADTALRHGVYRTLAEAESRRGRLGIAAGYYRYCIETCGAFPGRLSELTVALAETLFRLGDRDEAATLLAGAMATETAGSAAHIRGLRLRAAMAEAAGDLRAVVDLERGAFALECALGDGRLMRLLDNIELVAQADRIIHESDLEREREAARSRELTTGAGTARRESRAVDAVERRLHDALRMVPPGTEQRARAALSDALRLLREESPPT